MKKIFKSFLLSTLIVNLSPASSSNVLEEVRGLNFKKFNLIPGLGLSNSQGICDFNENDVNGKSFVNVNSFYIPWGVWKKLPYGTVMSTVAYCASTQTIEHEEKKNLYASAKREGSYAIYFLLHPLDFLPKSLPLRKISGYFGIGLGMQIDSFYLAEAGEENYESHSLRMGLVTPCVALGSDRIKFIYSQSFLDLARSLNLGKKYSHFSNYSICKSELNIYNIKVVGNILNFK